MTRCWLPFVAIPLAVALLAAVLALVIGLLSLRVKGVYFSMITLAFNKQAAALIGINVRRIVILGYALSAGLAGLGGIMCRLCATIEALRTTNVNITFCAEFDIIYAGATPHVSVNQAIRCARLQKRGIK
jgi:ABC-type branched-subunit amino acid transport system permease subunit